VKRFLRHTLLLFTMGLAQTCEVRAQDFYPLEIRNTWNYTVFSNNYPHPPDAGTIQLTVLNDTLMPNGRVYHQLSGRDVLGATLVRAETDFVYYYSPYTGSDVPMYNLRASVGTVDTLRWDGLGSSRVSLVAVQSVFGLQKMVRRYAFDGLVQYAVTLADGFGIIHAEDYGDGGWPYVAMWDIRGSIIRDTLYGTVLSISDEKTRTTKLGLYQNYPNPFNPSTTIKYELPTSSVVKLSVYDMLGREVSVLVNERRDAGVHEVRFDGTRLSSGVYFCRLTARSFVQTRKFLLIR
jgi:hypothetical protein